MIQNNNLVLKKLYVPTQFYLNNLDTKENYMIFDLKI